MKQISFRLRPGQLLKEEIENAAHENNIQAGVLLSIVGALNTVVLRMAGTEIEDQDIKTWEGPHEIVAGTGTISKNGCHIHLSVSDKSGDVVGGHLKDGCVVAITAEIVLGVFDDIEFKRTFDSAT